MKNFLVILGLIFSVQIASAQIIIDQLPDVEYRNADGTRFMPNSENYPRISKIEKMIFGQAFLNEPIEIRLRRLETRLYKKENDNLSLSERVDLISAKLDEMSIDTKELNTLSSLEKKMFNQNYKNDNVQNRVQRLEKYILGAYQQGELNDRIATLKTASSSIGTYSNVPQMYQPQSFSNTNGIVSKVRNFVNYLSRGVMTGFSPSITNYPSYYPPVQTYTPYAQRQIFSPYDTLNTMPYQNMPMNNPRFQNLFGFSDGGETYYNNGEYLRKIQDRNAGCAVTIID